jgi:cytochrome c553
MIELARAMTEEEIVQSAEYFAAIQWKPRVKVIETGLVPKTRIVGNLFLPLEEAHRADRRPAHRSAEDEARSETVRDPRAGFIAYVPEGSLARGKRLVTLGGATIVDNEIIQGKTTPCTACHAPDLMGVGKVPPIAGRSPSYLARQLFDIQQGTRRGRIEPTDDRAADPDDIAIATSAASADPKDVERRRPRRAPTAARCAVAAGDSPARRSPNDWRSRYSAPNRQRPPSGARSIWCSCSRFRSADHFGAGEPAEISPPDAFAIADRLISSPVRRSTPPALQMRQAASPPWYPPSSRFIGNAMCWASPADFRSLAR